MCDNLPYNACKQMSALNFPSQADTEKKHPSN